LVAAVIAALVSIGNILLTAHLGRRTEIQKGCVMKDYH
jgi:hypothetical protein